MPLAAPAPPRDYRAEFPIFRRTIYLNSCSLGALSTRSRARVNECLDLWETGGASAWYEIWWAALAELRSRYARLIGAPEGSVALHPNISCGLTSVAESLDYRRRPKVVVTSLDFPTVAYQWLARAVEGVEVVMVESPDGIGVPAEAVARAVDERTALVATSHVFFTTGAIQDVRALADLVHAKGALLLVDG
jgi:selenocysteine lyase/cysteine desulfurase